MPAAHETIQLAPSPNGAFTVGLISDTHYWPGGGAFHGSDGSLQLLGQSELLLETLTAALNEANVDLVLHLGDVTCGGGTYPMDEAEFYEVQDASYSLLHRLQAPIYTLPGNHDCPPRGGPWTYFERMWEIAPGMGRTVDTPNARLVLLNSQGHTTAQIMAARPGDPVYGWVSDGELARLDEALATAEGRPVILFVHQLLQPWSGDREFVRYYPVKNADAVLDVLAEHGNVRAVFQGHAHRLDVQQLAVGGQPCWFIVTPAIVQYPVGWLALTLTPQTVRVQLRLLPLPALIEQARVSGDGQTWRAGKPDWHDFTIELR